jgi:hypothetical protein
LAFGRGATVPPEVLAGVVLPIAVTKPPIGFPAVGDDGGAGVEKGRCRIFYQMNGRTGRVDLNETANFFALRAIQGGGERNQELKDGRIGWGPGRELMRGLQYFGEIVANLLGA